LYYFSFLIVSKFIMFALEAFTLEVKTTAGTDILDLTAAVAAQVKQTGVAEGLLTLFISGSTAALSTIEFESGVINDLRAAIERLFPQDIPYEHDRRWGDGNGYAHVRAAFLKPSLGIPLAGGRLQLGTWQQIVLLDFDNRPRQRHIQGQVMGLKSGRGSRQPG
jgi:secondary thiamine-phosphate synthase enzyme